MNVKHVIAFIAGAAIGAVATWKFIESKYAQLAEKEINEVKEFYDAKTKAVKPAEPEQAPWRIEKPDLLEYAAKIREARYSIDELNTNEEEKGGGESMDSERPYVISPEEFGEEDEFETASLTYYEDGVLTDYTGEVIENVDEIVGVESLDHFGEYEDDSVFVRNEALHVDYEILRDIRKYSDIEVSTPADEE